MLRGSLQPELGGTVRVEFPLAFLPDPVEPLLDKMRANLPKQPAVWLLRWQGAPPAATKPGAPPVSTADPTLYRVVHPNCGVFMQGGRNVVAATATSAHEHASPRAAQAEGERFATLSELAAHARTSR